MKIRALFASFVLLLGLAVSATAQTTLTSTTLSVAANADTNIVTVASATGVDVGDYLFVDREAMRVLGLTGTQVRVTRGFSGTGARAHAAAAIVYVGAPSNFASVEVVNGSTCTATAETYTPRIVLPTGNVYKCQNSNWRQIGSEDSAIYVTCRTLLFADAVDQSCFTADRDYILINATEVHTTAETAGTLALELRRQQGTEAPASGDALTASSIDMVGAGAVAQTVKTPALTTTAATRLIFAGDRLGLDFTGDTAGELAGVTVTFTLVPR